MKHKQSITRRIICGLAVTGALALSGLGAGVAAQEASTHYKGVARDPFVKLKPPSKPPVPKNKPVPVDPPPIQQRIDRYKALKVAAMNAQQPAPKPTTALLLSELDVTGIFHTPRGYAAMVEAKPIKLSYVIYPGENFFDGQLVAVEEGRLIFRRYTNWSDGRRTVDVDTKPLRVENAVSDSMTVTRASAASDPKETAGSSDPKDAVSQKAAPAAASPEKR
jgi:hypothetical protein